MDKKLCTNELNYFINMYYLCLEKVTFFFNYIKTMLHMIKTSDINLIISYYNIYNFIVF